MSRIVSAWLPRWPILRFLAVQTNHPFPTRASPGCGGEVDPDRPFVLVITAAGGPRIAALNEAAEAAGLALGEPLADARAKTGFLQARPVDAAADAAALRRLALWATRYTPTAAAFDAENGADGFFLDIEGAAHLFGNEKKLLADLASRLRKNFGLPARLAVADTPGAAWALSRFHPVALSTSAKEVEEEKNGAFVILPSGHEAEALTPLPVEALRLSPDTCQALRRLGFKSVGTLLDKPRAPLAARFRAELLQRLDQALGRIDEPLVPIITPPVYHSVRYLLEPILTQEAVVALASRLMNILVRVLERDDVGARFLRLSLYRVDGMMETVDLGLTLPTRNVAHIVHLIDLKLETLATMRDPGFGFEAVGLAITRAERIAARQNELPCDGGLGWGDADRIERCAALIDRLRQRLGPQSVRRFVPIESHIPEQVEMLKPMTAFSSPAKAREVDRPNCGEGGDNDLRRAAPPPPCRTWSSSPAARGRMRPLLLLPQAEPTEVTALVPDGPPRRFCWRGVTYEVAGAQGPERIAAEWWREPNLFLSRSSGNPALNEEVARNGAPDRDRTMGTSRGHEPQQALTRDYYIVEDAGGHRFWIYREGLYGRETAAARWFVHGLFA